MKKIILALALTAVTSASYANTAQCTASDGTILRGDLIEGSMMAELVNITIQNAGQSVQVLPANIKGVVYTNITGQPDDVVVMDIYDDAINPTESPDNRSLYKIRGAVAGNPKSGSILTEVATNLSQAVICVEIKK